MHSNETFQNNHPWKNWKISDPASATTPRTAPNTDHADHTEIYE
jgi:hypothetical protein